MVDLNVPAVIHAVNASGSVPLREHLRGDRRGVTSLEDLAFLVVERNKGKAPTESPIDQNELDLAKLKPSDLNGADLRREQDLPLFDSVGSVKDHMLCAV